MSIRNEDIKKNLYAIIKSKNTDNVEQVVHLHHTKVGTESVSKNIDVTGDLSVRGNSSVTGDLLVTGSVNSSANISAAKSMYLSGSMFVSGTSTVFGNSYTSGSMTVSGSFMLYGRPSGKISDRTTIGHRLTLSSSIPVITSNAPSASTLYFTPYTSNQISLYDGTNWIDYEVNEISYTLSSLSSGYNYDVFIYLNSGTPTLELTVWSTDTSRVTDLTRQDGTLVKSGEPTRRYIGTIRTTGTSTTEDSTSKRYVYNHYNRVPRQLLFLEPATSWSSAGGAYSGFRAANNGTNNPYFDVVVGGITGDAPRVWAHVRTAISTASAAAAGWVAGVGIGIDSSTTNSAQLFGCLTPGTGDATSGIIIETTAYYDSYPSIGFHRIWWIESCAAAGGPTVSYYGDLNAPSSIQMGMKGEIVC